MRIISIVPITEGMLDYSSVALSESEWSAGTYTLGQQARVGLNLYQVLVTSTTDEPTVGAAADPKTWGLFGKVNRWRMFDGSTRQSTADDDEIEVHIIPGQVVSAIALFKLGGGGEVRVWMEDPVDGIVYDQTLGLIDNSNVVDFYTYAFEPFQQRYDAVFTGLPPYGSATIKVRLAATNASIAQLAIGRLRNIGLTLNGTSVGTVRYGTRRTDEFGNTSFVRRQSVKRANFECTVETGQIDRVQRQLDDERDQPVAFIGDEGFDSLLIFGSYLDFDITFRGPSISDGVIRVEGL